MMRQVLRAATLDRRLRDAAPALRNEVQRLDDHAFSALTGHLRPPRGCVRGALLVVQIDNLERSRKQQLCIGCAELRNHLHVPGVRLVGVDCAFAREYVEGGEFEIADGVHGPAVLAIRPGVVFNRVQTLAYLLR